MSRAAEEAVNETEKNMGDEKPLQEDDTGGVNPENSAKEPEETEPEDKVSMFSFLVRFP